MLFQTTEYGNKRGQQIMLHKEKNQKLEWLNFCVARKQKEAVLGMTMSNWFFQYCHPATDCCTNSFFVWLALACMVQISIFYFYMRTCQQIRIKWTAKNSHFRYGIYKPAPKKIFAISVLIPGIPYV